MSESTKNDWKEWAHSQAQIIEKHTGIPAKIIVPVLGLSCFLVLIGYLENYITTIVGTVYPAYWSLKALESQGSEDDTQWLTYWIVFALFSLLDQFSGVVLHIIPFYFFLKIVFLIWCFMPNTRGASVVYNNVIRQLFKKYEKDLDKLNEKFSEKLGQTVSGVVETTKQTIVENRTTILKAGIEVADRVNEFASDKKSQ
jgi:receptor expression-enhancing protein 5/6